MEKLKQIIGTIILPIPMIIYIIVWILIAISNIFSKPFLEAKMVVKIEADGVDDYGYKCEK